MTTLTAFNFDLGYSENQIESFYDHLELASTSPTLIRFVSRYGGNLVSEIRGSGFVFDAYGYPLRGTVTGLQDAIDGKRLFAITDFSMAISTFIALSDNGDALMATLFAGADTLKGSPGGDLLEGLAGADTIHGNAGNDMLDGGTGNDRLYGGAGDDVYRVDSVGDVVSEEAGAGTDGIISLVTYVLPANVEHLKLDGAGRINATGNGQGNQLDGNANANTLSGMGGDDGLFGHGGTDILEGGDGNDLLDGGEGADRMVGGAGNDTFIVDNLGDTVVEAAGGGTDTILAQISYRIAAQIERLVLAGTAAIDGMGDARGNEIRGNGAANRLTGEDGDDQLFGDAGKDTLIGGAGNDVLDSGFDTDADRLEGGAGNDTYAIHGDDDVVIELAGGGIDEVIAYTSLTLGANVENMTVMGGSVTGNELDNLIVSKAINQVWMYGGAGDDTIIGSDQTEYLSGQAGNDILRGGKGHDTYIVDSVFDDEIIEEADGGFDTVGAENVDIVLPEHVERLFLSGKRSSNGTGNAEDNSLYGSVASNVLRGLAGDDHIDAGKSDDVLDGGAGDDRLFGGDGNDTLLGGEGSDSLNGGKGNDIYEVTLGDIAFEARGEGRDLVRASVAHVLGDNFEDLTLTGAVAIGGTGNAVANRITGNDRDNILYGLGGNDTITGGRGNDLLDGGTGVDTMDGGVGNDTYVVDSARDRITERGGQGTDTVQARISFTLGANLENLVLGPTGSLKGTGNELANAITGGDGANALRGLGGNDTIAAGAGNDTIDGGLGNDLLTGGEGKDIFVFEIGVATPGKDKVLDFQDSADRLKFIGSAASYADFLAAGGSVEARGADTLVFFDASHRDYLRLVGIDDALIGKSDFIFG